MGVFGSLEPEPEPLRKKTRSRSRSRSQSRSWSRLEKKSGAGAAKKLASSSALREDIYGARRYTWTQNNHDDINKLH